MYYKEIENLYKKEGSDNKLNRIFIYALGFIISILSIIFYFSKISTVIKNIIIIITIMAFTILVTKRIYEKILNQKLFFKPFNKDGLTVETISYYKEVKMMKNYLISKNLYNDNAITNITNHYRDLISPKTNQNELWAIITYEVSFISLIMSKDGQKIILLDQILFLLTELSIYTLLFYAAWKCGKKLVKMLIGNFNIYIKLESIFSDILLMYISEQSI